MKLDSRSYSKSIAFPYQKRSISKKGKAFMKSCVDAGIHMTVLNQDEGYRASRRNKMVNYDLANGIVHEDEMYKITNPFGITGFDREIQDYPLVRPRLNLLIGEESNRRFEFECRVVNPDAISQKEKQVKEDYIAKLSQIVLSNSYDEKDAKKQMQDVEKWRKYESQDMREIMSTQILQYLQLHLQLKRKFNEGMEDALIGGEEIYRIDVVSGEPVVIRINPLNLYTVRTNDSPFVDDADILVEDGFHSIGYVIDNYYEELTSEDIDDIEKGALNVAGPSRAATLNYTDSEPYPITGDLIEVDTRKYSDLGSQNRSYDEFGRIKVTRVVWRSLRKVGEVKVYDEAGRLEKRYVDEFYKPDEQLGEEIKWMWIGEWWEGTRIGKDIYVKLGPRPIQFRRFTNRSASSSGYVGTLYNVNNTTTRSLMDIMKPYQYLYDEFMDRIKDAFAKFKGPMIELDFAKMPEGWEPEKWMHYAENMGYLIVDSFKEGRKGASTGKLAGGYNTTNKVLNPDLGNYIQHHIMMLEYIEKQIGIISGIPDQRMGEIQSRETVGGVERAVTQSSHITETIFSLHDATKLRVLETLLETAKYAWKNDKKKMQYALDDMSFAILNVDGEIFNEAEYGIFVTDSRDSTEMIQTMKQLAHAMVQNGELSMRGLLDIYTTPSIQAMRRKIDEYDKIQAEREAEQAEMQQKSQQEALAAQQKAHQAEMAQKEKESIRDAETKIAVALINKQEGTTGEEGNAEEMQSKLELEKQKLELAKDKLKSDEAINKRKQVEIERTNKAKESIARTKSTQSSTTNK